MPAATVSDSEEEELIPKFLRGTDEEEKTGASRGTVYHHFLECLDYGKLRPGATEEERTAFVEAERKRMLEKGLMTREDDASIKLVCRHLTQRPRAENEETCEQPLAVSIRAKKKWKGVTLVAGGPKYSGTGNDRRILFGRRKVWQSGFRRTGS